MEVEAVFGGAAADTVRLQVLEHAEDTSSLNDLTSITRFHSLEFQIEIFLENQFGILINRRFFVDGRDIELSKLGVGLLHAVQGVAWNLSIQLVLDWLEVFSNVESDFLSLLLFALRSSVSLKGILTVTPSNYSVYVRWENWLYSSISGLLADMHGNLAGRHFG